MEAVYWKSISMMVMNYMFTRYHGAYVLDVPRKFHKLMLLRAFTGFLGLAGIFIAVKHLPVSTANCIIMIDPLFVALLSFIFMGDKILEKINS